MYIMSDKATAVSTQSSVSTDSINTPSKEPRRRASTRGRFPTWGDLLAILGLFLLTQLITRFIFGSLGLELPTILDLTTFSHAERRAAEFSVGYSTFMWSIIAQPMILALVLIYRQMRGGALQGRVRYSMRGFDPTILLWGVVMLLSVVVVIEPLMEMLPDGGSPTGRGMYMLCALLVVAPVFEELLCRGVIFEAIRAKRGAWAACVISSMIFGLMHIEPQFVLNAFIIGLLLSYIYMRTRSIFAPIILHSINNLFAYVLLIFELSDSSLHELLGGGVIYKIVYAVAAAVLLISFIAITRYINRLERSEREQSEGNQTPNTEQADDEAK